MNKPNIRSFDRYQELARRTQNPHLDRQGKLATPRWGCVPRWPRWRPPAARAM